MFVIFDAKQVFTGIGINQGGFGGGVESERLAAFGDADFFVAHFPGCVVQIDCQRQVEYRGDFFARLFLSNRDACFVGRFIPTVGNIEVRGVRRRKTIG